MRQAGNHSLSKVLSLTGGTLSFSYPQQHTDESVTGMLCTGGFKGSLTLALGSMFSVSTGAGGCNVFLWQLWIDESTKQGQPYTKSQPP